MLYDQNVTGRVAQKHNNGLAEGHGGHLVIVQKSRGLHQAVRVEMTPANLDATQPLNSTTV